MAVQPPCQKAPTFCANPYKMGGVGFFERLTAGLFRGMMLLVWWAWWNGRHKGLKILRFGVRVQLPLPAPQAGKPPSGAAFLVFRHAIALHATLRDRFTCLQPAIVLYAYSCHCLARLYAAITLLAYTPLSLYTLTLRYRFAYLQPAIVLHTYSRHCLSRLFPPLPCSPILRYRFVCFQTAALYQ